MIRSRLVPVISWLALLTTSGWWLLGAGSGRLAAPDLGEPGSWTSWLSAREPVDAAFALLRLGALAAVGYLLLITLVGVLARCSGRARLVRWSDRASLPLVRRALDGAVGVGFTASALGLAFVPIGARVVAAAAPGAAVVEVAAGDATMRATSSATAVATATMSALPDAAEPAQAEAVVAAQAEGPASSAAATLRATEAAGGGTATMAASTPADAGPTPADAEPTPTAPETAGEPASLDDPAPTATAGATPAEAVLPASMTWTVAPGDHLWSIAEHTVSGGTGTADEDVTAEYWQRLITVNRDVLVDPDCPDLLFVGQVLTLPQP